MATQAEFNIRSANAMQEYVDCYQRKKTLERETKENNARIETLQDEVLREFMEQGARSISLKNGATVYIHTDTYASLKNDEDGSKDNAHRVMRKYKLGYMVKPNVNAQTLRSWVIQQRDEEIPIPDELRAVLNITEKESVRVSAR